MADTRGGSSPTALRSLQVRTLANVIHGNKDGKYPPNEPVTWRGLLEALSEVEERLR
jgi:hypothetical protein